MISLRSSPITALWLATAAASFLASSTTAKPQEIEAFPCQGTETRFSIITTLLGIFGTEHCSVLRADDNKMLFQCHYESGDYTATADLIYSNEVTHLTVVDSDHKGREDWMFPSKDTVQPGLVIDNMYHNSRDNDLIESACLGDMTYLADVRDRIGGREDVASPPADVPLPCEEPVDSPWTVLFALYETFGRKNCAKRSGDEETIECNYYATTPDDGTGGVSAEFRYDVANGVDLTVSEIGSDGSSTTGAYYETYTIPADGTDGGTYYSTDTNSETTGTCLDDMKLLKRTYSEIRGFATPSPSDSPSASPSSSFPSASPSSSFPSASPSSSFPSASPSAAPTTASPSSSPTVDPQCIVETHESVLYIFEQLFGGSNCWPGSRGDDYWIWCEITFDDGYSVEGNYDYNGKNVLN